MTIEVITNYKSGADLKKKVMQMYVKGIKAELEINKVVLADPCWASTDSEYHKQCRIEMQNLINETEKQLRVLSVYYNIN